MRARLSTRTHAFTLVEVVLAILIICGIMTVLLFFYQRAAQVRQNALQEVEFISLSRLLMEQITTELRGARVAEEHAAGLNGTLHSISFICASLPAAGRWLTDTNEPLRNTPATDLKRMHYGLLGGTNAAAGSGIERRESFLTGAGLIVDTNLIDTGLTNDLAILPDPAPTNSLATTNLASMAGLPLTEKIQFLQFRFWDGTEWVESWPGPALPRGVEISMGRQAMPVDNAAEGYPYELFRRVVFLPQSSHSAAAALASPFEEEEAL